jgi:replicative DNA helicase
MSIVDYQLSSEFQDPAIEALALHVLAAGTEAAQRWGRQLRAEHFACHAVEFEALGQGRGLTLSVDGEPAAEEAFLKAIERLEDLACRRRIARLQEDVAAALFDESQPAASALAVLEDRYRSLQEAPVPAAKLFPASALAGEVVDWAQKRSELRRSTGKPVMGISTGLSRLDRMLNGWFPGLHVVAAGPGVGKTTLCMQFAWHAALEGFPVLYVSYENAARNLMLKLLCARAGVAAAEVERGFGDMDKLNAAWRENAAVFERIQLLEGDGRLRISSVESVMRAFIRDLQGPRSGLVVFDYLQRAAHSLGYEQLRQNVSLLTGELRELSMRLDCPLIAISSQNRAAGDYGRGGSGALDSLKESGDLEYGADTVSLLYSPNDGSATPPARELELKVAKNRFGETGAFRLIFRPDTGVFREKL